MCGNLTPTNRQRRRPRVIYFIIIYVLNNNNNNSVRGKRRILYANVIRFVLKITTVSFVHNTVQ